MPKTNLEPFLATRANWSQVINADKDPWPCVMYVMSKVPLSVIQIRLRPIPEFTDTTDTDTLDLHRCRYRVPIPVVTLQPPRQVVSRYNAWALSRPVIKVLNISISIPITIFENQLPLPLWRPCPSYWQGLCCSDATFQLPQNASFNIILRLFCWLQSVLLLLLAVMLSNQTSHRPTLAVALDGRVWGVVVVRCPDSVYMERRGSVALSM